MVRGKEEGGADEREVGGGNGVSENATYQKAATVVSPSVPSIESSCNGIAADDFGSPPNTLTEPVWDTIQWDLSWIVSNLKLIIFPNPFQEDPGKALRDWDLWS